VRVLVCGGRYWNDAEAIRRELVALGPSVECVIHGGADGADTLAGRVAAELGIPVRVFRAEWDRYGRAAGPIRNTRMLDEGQPDLVLAFHADLSRSRGTADMVAKARARGIPVRVVDSRSRSLCE